MEQASESSQNVEIFKIKKLIKGLEAARGYAVGSLLIVEMERP
jgi:hypothetical protein